MTHASEQLQCLFFPGRASRLSLLIELYESRAFPSPHVLVEMFCFWQAQQGSGLKDGVTLFYVLETAKRSM
jgi:hypothetical protein